MANSALIDDLRKQFAENPRRVFARLANEYRKRGELDSAIEICRNHVPLQPSYISGHIVLGQALYDSGSLDEARTTFETALELDPENLIALRHMGDISRANGDVTSARSWYRRLLEIDPQNEDVASQIEALDADGGGAAEQGSTPQNESGGWGDVNPGAIELAPEDTAEATSTTESEVATLIEGLETTAVPDVAGTHAAPLELVDLDDLAPEASESLFEDAVEAQPSSRAVPPLYPPDPYGADAYHGSEPDDSPSAFATETMAELYLQQGLPDRALAIYRELAARSPENASLRERVAELEESITGAAASVPASGKSSRTAREFFGVLAYRRAPRNGGSGDSTVELLAGEGTTVSEEDEDAAAALAGAFGASGNEQDAAFAQDALLAEAASGGTSNDVDAESEITSAITAEHEETAREPGEREAPVEDAADHEDAVPDVAPVEGRAGKPGREASDALSLDDVFRDAPARGDSRRESGVSFDEFFARRESGVVPERANGTAAAESEGATVNGNHGAEDAPQDLELFHAWLDGLKS